MPRIFVVTFLFLFYGLLHFKALADPLRVEKGMIRLSKAEILKQAISLDGNWKFSFHGQDSFISVPGSWTGAGYPKFGIGTYEIDIEFDEDIDSLAIRSDHFATEYRILANDHLILGPNTFTTDPSEVLAIHPSVISMPVNGRKLNIKIVVSNRVDQIAGIIRSIQLGTPAHILEDLSHRMMAIIPLMSVFSLLTLYFLLISMRKDHRFLALILAACSVSTIVFFTVQYIFFKGYVATWVAYIHLFDLGWFGAAYFFGIYNSHVFRWNLPRWYEIGFQHIPVLIYVLTLTLSIEIRSYILIGMHVQILISVLINFAMTVRAVTQKIEGSRSFLVASVMMAFAAINDILFAMGFIQSLYLFGYVFILYLMMQAHLLARRHGALLIESAQTQQLKSQIVLAQKFSGTTEQFTLQHPHMNCTYAFQPADAAGGDWIYIKQEQNRIYFFLADVTDHGFASALMTLVISSSVIAVLDEHRDQSINPEFILEKCATVANRAVCRVGESLQKFSTLTLHSLDLIQGTLSFLQAGHMPTLVCGNNGSKALQNSHGLLGFDPNIQFKALSFQLTKGDKVFAYTDGLTENIVNSSLGPLKPRKLSEILKNAKDTNDIAQALNPYLQGSQMENADDTAFIAISWTGQNEALSLSS